MTEKTLDKYQAICDQSIVLMDRLKSNSITTVTTSLTYMELVIRWSQMELALLRTLEEIVRNHPLDFSEDTAGILLRLDDFRDELRKQQQAELEKSDARE